MKKALYTFLCAGFLAGALLSTASCKKYNPFDSYWHGGFEREETGGKPGKGGLFADGYGTEESPYGLSTPQHMLNIPRGLVEGEMIYFKLKNDIDMDDINWTALNPTDPYKKFIDFDGGGHVILNLYVSRQAYGSFFGVLCGECHDVGFLNAYVESSNGGGIIGGYVGLRSPADGNFTGRVSRTYVTGTVRAGGNAGGICGDLGRMSDMMPCAITDCYSLAEVTGNNAGGLAGNMHSGSKIEKSYAAIGSVNGSTSAGGLAGSVSGGTITNSIAWNPYVTGTAYGPVYGAKTSGSVSECYAISSGTHEGVTQKTADELQAIAGAWEENWYPDGAVSNGYPILKWQQARGDYGPSSGHGGAGGSGGEGGGGEYTKSFKGGTGTESDPYLIETLDHLMTMQDTLKADSETWFRLVADIQATAFLNEWKPLNAEEPYDKKIHFDGNNHTISKLKFIGDSYPGFFGVLNGECKDVTFSDCKVHNNKATACGILGGWAGTMSGLTATLSHVRLDASCVVHSSGSQPCGGLFGCAAAVTVTDCRSAASVTSTNPSDQTGAHGCGGLIGKVVKNDVTFTRCANTGSIDGTRLVGGLVGWSGNIIHFTDCRNTGSVTVAPGGSANGARGGGIIAHIQDGSSITRCSNSGAITANTQAGGIVGYMEASNNIVVSQCFSTGNIRSKGNFAGGICGYAASGQISDCWTSGTITVDQQGAGGIVGEIKSGYINADYPDTRGQVLNCWSKAILTGKRVLGGIAGRCAHDGWNATATDSQATSDITISHCIAWNPSITATETGDSSNKSSSGAVVAYTYIKNTLSDCYRSSGLAFTGPYEGSHPVDQPDVSPDNPLTVGVAPTYQYPWHGKKAGVGMTVTSLAQSLGWSADIWDFSGSEPTLK